MKDIKHLISRFKGTSLHGGCRMYKIMNIRICWNINKRFLLIIQRYF